jgi:hypothetical protein
MRSEWELQRRQFRVLYRVFLTRAIDLELLSANADTTQLVGQFVTIFAFFSFWCALPALLIGMNMPQVTSWLPEHFFIATTMVVVGAISVMTWDSALPDRRDVLVLAPLPVRASTLFAAKIAALFAAPGLAIFALNVFTGITWPLVFGYHKAGFLHGMRAWPAYWMTIVAAGAFLFCALLTLHGLVANLLPRQLFLRLSAFLQAGILCALVCVYILEPSLESPAALIAPGNQRLLAWLPTYWFLGLFQQLNGSMRPEFVPLVRRAWIGSAVSIAGAVAAVALSYWRMLPRIAEQPEILPGARGSVRLPRFAGQLNRAVGLFTLRTLMRSRQHRMVLSFYLGIGLAIVVAYGKTSLGDEGIAISGIPVTSMLASVLMTILALLAVRVVVALPISLPANWIFGVTQVRPARRYQRAVRLSWLLLILGPILLAIAACFLAAYPWRPVLMHLWVLLALGVLMVELSVAGFRRMPFACSYLPGKANIHFVFWATLVVLIRLLKEALQFEERALVQPMRLLLLVVSLAVAAVAVGLFADAQSRTADELVFEETYAGEMVTLKLS